MKKAIWVLALLVVGATTVSAQHQHNATVLGGQVRDPNRIPDAVAYRIYLTAVAGMDADHREKSINMLGFSAADKAALNAELDKFRDAREAMRQAYNQHQIETQGGDTASILAYQKAVADLVESTRQSIAARTTSSAFVKLTKWVEREKSNMTISETEASK